MSMFNEDCICMVCKERETHRKTTSMPEKKNTNRLNLETITLKVGL